MNAALHILNSHRGLDKLAARIDASFADAIHRISPRLPVKAVDVVVRHNPAATIPELGLCGFCPSADLVFINLDAEHAFLNAHLETEFVAMLAHELHHAARWAGPGYGSTLLEALASEGLACCFETEFRGGSIPHYAQALSAVQMQHANAEALKALKATPRYDHSAWFFGTGALPVHAGYSLGFELASHLIKIRHADAAALVHEPASSFVPLLRLQQQA